MKRKPYRTEMSNDTAAACSNINDYYTRLSGSGITNGNVGTSAQAEALTRMLNLRRLCTSVFTEGPNALINQTQDKIKTDTLQAEIVKSLDQCITLGIDSAASKAKLFNSAFNEVYCEDEDRIIDDVTSMITGNRFGVSDDTPLRVSAEEFHGQTRNRVSRISHSTRFITLAFIKRAICSEQNQQNVHRRKDERHPLCNVVGSRQAVYSALSSHMFNSLEAKVMQFAYLLYGTLQCASVPKYACRPDVFQVISALGFDMFVNLNNSSFGRLVNGLPYITLQVARFDITSGVDQKGECEDV